MRTEQAMGQPVDARSDLYSSGVVLYELLTGSNPRQSDNPTSALAKVLSQELPQIYTLEPGLPDFVQALLDGLLARDREQRFPNAQAVLSVLADELVKVRRHYPGLVAECLAHPTEMKQRLMHDRASEWYQRARNQFQNRDTGKEAAALWPYHPVPLDPATQDVH